jgi:hypothetical protein
LGERAGWNLELHVVRKCAIVRFFDWRRAIDIPPVQTTLDEAAVGTHSAIFAKATFWEPASRIA